MTWWWRSRRQESQRLLSRAEEVQKKSERLREQLLRTTAELDEFVAALNAEVGRINQQNPGGGA